MHTFNNIQIYYFSGTGNSLNVATWFHQIAVEKNYTCTIENIAKIDIHSIPKPEIDSLVVFISPVHGFNYPPIMLDFIFHFPKSKNPVVLMNTRAGMLLGKWITPGITGVAFYFSALILLLKGYKIKALLPVDLPSNWISVHPGLNERTITYLHEKNRVKVKSFASKIIFGKTDFKSVREIIQDILISPIAFLYYFVGRFLFAKSYFASNDCDNCGICSKNCPVQAIITIDKRLYWKFSCESCMKCMSNCHTKAIETAHGFVITWLILASIVIGFVFRLFEINIVRINNGFIHFILETGLTLAFLGFGYRLVHYLMRFSFIERLMVYTSLTKNKFWGKRYKALKDKMN